MKLLLLIHSLGSGGAERVLSTLANYWADKGWQITLVTMTSEASDFYKLDSRVRRIALNLAKDSSNPVFALLNNLKRVVAVRRVLCSVKPDVAVAMMSTANIMLAISKVSLKVKPITVGSERIHPPRQPLGFSWEKLRNLLYGQLDAVVALTNESASWLRNNTKATRVEVIPNAANWPLTQQEPWLTPPDRQFSNRHQLLAVGRLDTQKGFALLLEIWQSLADEFANWDLIILGEGPERLVLERQICTFNLQDRVKMPGRAGNVSDWYVASDVFVMTSAYEGFPNTLVEAMAHGMPVVSFDCETGPSDIIRHNVDGLLARNQDKISMRKALETIMKDESLRASFARRSKEVRERLSMNQIGMMWETLFKDLLANRKKN